MIEVGFQEVLKVGENDYGYWFGVGFMFGCWYGFAVGKDSAGDETMLFLPGCDGANDFPESGECDGEAVKVEIIKRVGAVAQSFEHGYGGVARWFVGEDVRGRPEDYVCSQCGSVLCSEMNNHSIYPDFEEEPEFVGGDDEVDIPSYGSCCACEGTVAVRNAVLLEKKTPVPGTGWGCFQCNLSRDGAVAMVCDSCIERNQAGEIKFACSSNATDPGRIPISELSGDHLHDMSLHPESPGLESDV
jgi:hypothetical protein